MIVNTVAPDAVEGDVATKEPTVSESHSAQIELRFVVEDNVVSLAQVGPDFAIVQQEHGGVTVPIGTRGVIEVHIDDKVDTHSIETTTEITPEVSRFSYKRLALTEMTSNEISATTSVTLPTDGALSKAEQERLFWEEVKLLGSLRDSEEDRAAIESTLAAKRSRQKELQVELNELAMKIPQLEEELEESVEQTLRVARALWQLKAPANQVLPAIAEQPIEQTPPAIEGPSTETQPSESAEWRTLATAELLAGIKGLGKKKLQTICELAPTVGHLEDLRGQASREHKQYNEVLPDGCGAGVAQMIEDRLVAHIANIAKQNSGDNPLADELLKNIRQLAATDAWKASDCIPDGNDTEQTHLGYAAFNEGKPHTALPTQNSELARQWMLGWVCAEIIKHSPPADSSEASELAKQQTAEAAPEKDPKPKKPRRAKVKNNSNSQR